MRIEGNRPLRRRAFLKRAGVLVGVVASAGVESVWASWLKPSKSGAMPGGELLDDVAPSPAVVPFQAAFRVPPVLAPTRADADTDYYDITMRPAVVEILPGRTTTIWGYDGLFRGPTI
jgi:spore coat protein A, manganese oxidase